MTIQITKKGIVFSNTNSNLEDLQKEFNKNHCIVIPNFLQKELLNPIHDKLQEIKFYTKIHPAPGVEACTRKNPILTLLQFLANDRKLFRLIEQITGCKEINHFGGRIYSFIPGKGHHHSWHEDIGDNRLIAMSINLSTDVYSGGILKIRNRESKRIYREIANTGFGDVALFRIDDHLEHKVTHVKGAVRKISFAGWFRSKGSYESFLEQKLFKLNLNSNGRLADLNSRSHINLESKVTLNKEILERKLGDEMFVFIINTGKFCRLDSAGSYLWKHLKRNRGLLEVYKTMKKEFNVPAKDLQRDLLNILNQLHSIGLVKANN